MSTDEIRKAFHQENGKAARNKEDIHREILQRFPELRTMLPRPRNKAWASERYYTPLFNTVAMYLAWERRPSVMAEA